MQGMHTSEVQAHEYLQTLFVVELFTDMNKRGLPVHHLERASSVQ